MIKVLRAGEMALWLKALATLVQDPGLFPHTHTMDHVLLLWPCRHPECARYSFNV